MFLSDCCAAVLVSVMAVAVVACGRNDNRQGAAESPKPSDTAAQNEFWVEAPASAGEVREYYKGHLRREGLENVFAVLVITQKEGAPSRTYVLTEYRTNFGKGYTTTRSTGNLRIDALSGTAGETAAYRLDGGASPGQARVFVKTDDKLYVPKDPAALSAGFGDWTATLEYAARAANGRVWIDGLLSLPTPLIRLRTGDALVARSTRGYTVRPEATGRPLRQEGSSQDGDYQMFTFRAVEPGSTDLLLEDNSGHLAMAQVKVE